MTISKGLIYPHPGVMNRLRISQRRMSREFKLVLLIVLAHLPLGVVLYNTGMAAMLHPIVVFAVGLYWAFQTRYKLDRVALAIGYLIGAEVLWRMASVPVPWEFGKYGAAAIIFVALVRRGLYTLPQLPLLYFAALLPACIFPFIELDAGEARALLSSNLSGPFLLLMSSWFFANLRTTPLRLRRLMFAILVPIFSVGCATLFYTVTAEELYFSTESNLATSGGFGPNQVSSMLGLGVFIAACCLINFKVDNKFKILLGASAVFFAAQSVLTFSRGGIYNAVGASLALMFFQFRNVSEGMKRLMPILAISALFILFVFPALDTFTGGKLGERFEDTSTTNRVEIAQSEFEVFKEYPIWGTGIGLGREYKRKLFGGGLINHTEFSRLVAEHGTFGIVAIVALIAMAVANFRRQTSVLGRALVAGVSVWCALFMLNAGMRLAAPAFLWGLMFITIVPSRRLYLRSLQKRNESTGV